MKSTRVIHFAAPEDSIKCARCPHSVVCVFKHSNSNSSLQIKFKHNYRCHVRATTIQSPRKKGPHTSCTIRRCAAAKSPISPTPYPQNLDPLNHPGSPSLQQRTWYQLNHDNSLVFVLRHNFMAKLVPKFHCTVFYLHKHNRCCAAPPTQCKVTVRSHEIGQKMRGQKMQVCLTKMALHLCLLCLCFYENRALCPSARWGNYL